MRIDLPVGLRAVMGLVGAALLSATAVVIVNFGTGYYDSGYRLTAVFASSSQGLYEDSDVKVRGVNVGKIEHIELDDQGRALVHMTIREGFQVADTAHVSIEPLSVFGPKFLNLRLGEGELSGPFLADGDRITNTEVAPEFTLVLGDASDLLEHIEPGDVSTVIHTVAEGVGGLGDELGEMIDDIDSLADLVEADLPQARQFLADLALVSQTLADHSDELVAASGSLHQALPVLNSRPDQLRLLLDDVSRLSTSLSSILNDNADALDLAVVSLAPVVDLLHRRQGDVVTLVRTLDIFFGSLADILRLDNQPTTPIAGALIGGLPGDVCEIFPALPCGIPLGPP